MFIYLVACQQFTKIGVAIEDVKRIMNDPNYRLEYRYYEEQGLLRGFAWRLRTGSKPCALYIGKRNPIFEDVKAIVPEHHP